MKKIIFTLEKYSVNQINSPMKLHRLLILPLIFFAGCISLTQKYSEITYYQLNQEAGSFRNTATIEGTLQIRDFTAGEEFETDHLLAVWDNSKVQRYYYHRWITDCPSLVTDFIVTRYNNFRAFSEGVKKSGTILDPDYILEGQILDMSAHNSPEDSPGANYSSLSIQINVLRREPLKSEKTVLLSKLYDAKMPRQSSAVATIPAAFGKGLSQIADKLLIDIQESIAKFEENRQVPQSEESSKPK